jgi:hypothetical protein
MNALNKKPLCILCCTIKALSTSTLLRLKNNNIKNRLKRACAWSVTWRHSTRLHCCFTAALLLLYSEKNAVRREPVLIVWVGGTQCEGAWVFFFNFSRPKKQKRRLKRACAQSVSWRRSMRLSSLGRCPYRSLIKALLRRYSGALLRICWGCIEAVLMLY